MGFGKVGICGVIMTVVGLLFVLVSIIINLVIPQAIEETIKSAREIKSESESRKDYESFVTPSPDDAPWYVNYTFFNLTNYQDVFWNSAIPAFEEVGPFSFIEVSEKIDVRFEKNEEGDNVVAYKTVSTYTYVDEQNADYEKPVCNINLNNLGFAKVFAAQGKLQYNDAQKILPAFSANLIAQMEPAKAIVYEAIISDTCSSVPEPLQPLCNIFRPSTLKAASMARATSSAGLPTLEATKSVHASGLPFFPTTLVQTPVELDGGKHFEFIAKVLGKFGDATDPTFQAFIGVFVSVATVAPSYLAEAAAMAQGSSTGFNPTDEQLVGFATLLGQVQGLIGLDLVASINGTSLAALLQDKVSIPLMVTAIDTVSYIGSLEEGLTNVLDFPRIYECRTPKELVTGYKQPFVATISPDTVFGLSMNENKEEVSKSSKEDVMFKDGENVGLYYSKNGQKQTVSWPTVRDVTGAGTGGSYPPDYQEDVVQVYLYSFVDFVFDFEFYRKVDFKGVEFDEFRMSNKVLGPDSGFRQTAKGFIPLKEVQQELFGIDVVASFVRFCGADFSKMNPIVLSPPMSNNDCETLNNFIYLDRTTGIAFKGQQAFQVNFEVKKDMFKSYYPNMYDDFMCPVFYTVQGSEATDENVSDLESVIHDTNDLLRDLFIAFLVIGCTFFGIGFLMIFFACLRRKEDYGISDMELTKDP